MSKKEAYEKKVESQIEEWNAEISKLKAKADQKEADAQVAYHEEIEDLRAKQDALREKLLELRASSESAWEDVKTGVQKSFDDMQSAIRSAMDRF